MSMHKLLSAAVALLFSVSALAVEIDRMDPPFWYAGMKNHELQVMFHGKNIAAAEFSLKDYPGVTVKEVAKLKNPNYLVVYLDVSGTARPGTMTFQFKEGRTTTQKTFELRGRNYKVGAQGFTTKDVLYLIMPDRFSNGNPGNDNLENWTVNREGGGRHGGDIQGIKEHLDYIDALGVTAVWLNPVQFNRGNNSHGYSISDFYLIDPRLGSNEEYCDFIDAAHGRGIKVVMDMIFNHSGSSHWWIEDNPDSDWFNQNDYAVSLGERQRAPQTPGQPGQPGQQQFRRGQQVQFPATIEEFNALPADRREALLRMGRRQPGSLINTTHYKWTLMDPHAPQSEKDILVEGWFSCCMPDLNQRNRHLATYLIQNSIWWIEYSRIDGIRMDTYPYADYDFMVRWCREIEDEYPNFNSVGEGWYPRNSAAGWWQRGSSVNPNDPYLKT
ncbi:MAG: cyclomaltodextrinase N-terminal domain-containing protein, partial [Bacteroidales bacterium]|nr:cyclomaltodextrinase N-terminal domain-containing protein [Bacteroidales bacterium]